MNASDWEKLQRNWKELLEINPVCHIINHLYQEDVITISEKKSIEKLKVFDKEMRKLLHLLKEKPEKCKAFKHFLDALKADPVDKLIADKILETESKSDPSLKTKPNPDLLDNDVRTILHDNYANMTGNSIPLSEVRDLLKVKKVFTGQDEWSNIKLIEFIKETYTNIEEKKEKVGHYKKPITLLRNIGRISASVQEEKTAELESNISTGESGETKEVKDMSSPELTAYLAFHLGKDGPNNVNLEFLQKQDVTGKVFLSMTEEDFDKLLPEATFGARRSLSMLVAELTHKTDSYPAFLRHFDCEVTHTDKYTIGHCADVSVNIRSRKTHPVRNFHLIDESDKNMALEYIAVETIPFVSACLNDRRNGTIYFGISPNSQNTLKEGEIVGVSIPKEEVQARIRDAIKSSFTEIQKNILQNTVRDAVFVPVIGAEKNRFVVEVDVVPSTVVLEKDIIRTKEHSLPERFLRNHKGKDSVVFKFSEDGFPKIISSEELCQFEKVQQPRIVEQRKQEEQCQTNTETGPTLRTKLLNLLTGGSEVIQDTIYPFLMTSPLDDHMTQEFLKDRIAFIKYLKPHIVFDFDVNGSNAGLLKSLEDHHKESPRILTTNDFDERMTKPEAYKELEISLRGEEKQSWMFCNGCQNVSISELNPLEWNKERSSAFQKALKCFMDIFEKERILIIICLFSKNYTTMIEACDEVLRKLPLNWIVLAEKEDIAKLWQDQMLTRNKAQPADVIGKCVLGLPWEQVNSLVCHAANYDIIHDCNIPSSTGVYVDVSEIDITNWSDIFILPSNNFDINIPPEEKETLVKQVEEKFYRGDEVDWLNFYFKDHVLRRDIQSTLLDNVRRALEGRIREEQEKVSVISILHQPGAGGTTSAKQILWDLRNEYRCCLVKRITNETCEQIDEFRFFKDQRPKPILVLIDNEEKFEYLKDRLEEKARERHRSEGESFHVYCTIIACTRRASLPMQLKINQVALRQELTSNELEWFKDRHRTLVKRFQNNKDDNVNPEFLIAFNILRQNFNKEYVSKVVKAFSEDIRSDHEIRLLKFVSLLNTFDPDFKAIPVSCFDRFFSTSSSDYLGLQQGARIMNWETKLSQGIKVLLNLSSNKKLTNRYSQNLKVFCKIIAHEILFRMKERTQQKDSEIMIELLRYDIFQQTTADYNILKAIINNIFKKRETKKNGIVRRKFSDFILHIESTETAETVSELIELLFDNNSDPYTAQLLARYYIRVKKWSKAEDYAKCATERLPENSFFWDTYGQVFKGQLYEKLSSERNVQDSSKFNERKISELLILTHKCLMAFRKSQEVCECEASTNEGSNLVAYFGELRAIVLLLNALELSSQFQNTDVLHRYLVDKSYRPPELSFLRHDEAEFLKSLDSFSREAMRRLDDEFLQMKGKVNYSTEQQESDRKTLIELKASLDVYFGEMNVLVPKYTNERYSCDYRLRLARRLGASSLNSLLEIKKEGKKETLIQIFNLLKENITSDQRNFDDLRSMLDIVTVCLLDQIKISGLTYNHILEWSKEMYILGKQKHSSNRSQLELYLYYVLYNFPTIERSSFSLCMEVDLLNAIEEWKRAFKKNYPKSAWFHKRRETTLFFLGNGQPLCDVLFFDKTDVIEMYTIHEKWQHPQFRNNLRILNGILEEGGHEIKVQIQTPGKSGLTVNIPTAYPVLKNTMFKRLVYFYIGFSFSGPKAFGMCQRKPQSCELLPVPTKTVRVTSPRAEPEPLGQLILKLKTVLDQLKNTELAENVKIKLEKEQEELSRRIKSIIGD
ncbi:sterile alpha motif domain-containing protein 9-like isoform X2 [Biomphalaria glabrata]|nr:sterile alpha motif domain-containing protein 9-like isoform X2 [Biomphalaria glabrata]